MANLGLLSGLAEALKGGMESYRTERAYQDEKEKNAVAQAMQKKMYQMQLLGGGYEDSGDTVQKTEQQKQKETLAQEEATATLGKTKAETKKLLAEAQTAGNKLVTPETLSAAGSYFKAQKANENYEKATSQDYDPTNLMESKIGAVKHWVGLPHSAGKQLAMQAEQEFVDSVIGEESKRYNTKQREEAAARFFSRPGDTPDTVQQKNESRAAALAEINLKGRGSGSAYSPALAQAVSVQTNPGLLAAKGPAQRGLIPSAQAGESPFSSDQKAQALQWAKANPNDPRAKTILGIVGAK